MRPETFCDLSAKAAAPGRRSRRAAGRLAVLTLEVLGGAGAVITMEELADDDALKLLASWANWSADELRGDRTLMLELAHASVVSPGIGSGGEVP